MACDHHHDDDDHGMTICETIKNLLFSKDDDESEDEHDHHEESKWYEHLIICPDNVVYMGFDMLVTVLCLISGYYYGTMAGFRYSDLDALDTTNFNIQIVMESIFLVHMLCQFFLEIRIDENPVACRDLPTIVWNYIQTTFPIDFITNFPFFLIRMKRNRQYMFYVVKLLRIDKGFKLFDVAGVM